MTEAQRVVSDAKLILKEYGWVKNSYHDLHGRQCLMSACCIAAGVDLRDYIKDTTLRRYPVLRDVVESIVSGIEDKFDINHDPIKPGTESDLVEEFNDGDWRTEEELEMVLDSAIDYLDNIEYEETA